MKKIVFILGLTALLASCGTHKKSLATSKADKDISEFISALNSSLKPYKWLNARGRVTYTGGDQEFTASTSLRVRQDSLIWGIVNYLIEVARVEINNDSAVFLNRTQHEYSVFAISDLQKMLAIQGLNLKALQRLLMAYPPFVIDAKYTFTKGETDYKLENTTPAYMEQIILDAASLRMKQYVFKMNESRKIRITYEDFNKTDDLFLPKKINFELETPEKTQILFEISEYTLSDSEEVPFTIPASYRRH